MGYVFAELPIVAPLTKLHVEAIARNHKALVAQGHPNPSVLLGVLQRSREPITLPDGDVLYPPELTQGRKIVILGDTSDASNLAELAQDASVLVHESTNAYVPQKGQKTEGYLEEERRKVREKAVSRGHSTPDMAGEFARTIRAQRLFLNHFSAK